LECLRILSTDLDVLKKLEDMGQLDNTIVAFTTDNGAETITYPDGGVTPFKGQKGEAWEGGMRAPLVVRWPGVIKPGTVKNEMCASLDWLPTLVNIAGGPKGDGLKKPIEAGQYPGIVKTRLDGVDQRDYLEGKQDIESCFGEPNEALSTRCGGQGAVIFFGMAKLVRAPQIGPTRAP
jgi:arylsulfatase A-like enzyme